MEVRSRNVLTVEKVEQIKYDLEVLGRKGIDVAQEFGVTPGNISHIRTGRAWGNIQPVNHRGF